MESSPIQVGQTEPSNIPDSWLAVLESSTNDIQVYTDISDHFPIFCINLRNHSTIKTNNVINRSLSVTNIQTFGDAIEKLDWRPVQTCNDCQQSYTLFYEIFYKCYNESFPLRISRSRMRMRSPSCHNVDSYSVTFTDAKLFSDIKETTVIYPRTK